MAEDNGDAAQVCLHARARGLLPTASAGRDAQRICPCGDIDVDRRDLVVMHAESRDVTALSSQPSSGHRGDSRVQQTPAFGLVLLAAVYFRMLGDSRRDGG